MGRVVESRIGLFTIANYNKAVVIAVEGNFQQLGQKLREVYLQLGQMMLNQFSSQPTDYSNKC